MTFTLLEETIVIIFRKSLNAQTLKKAGTNKTFSRRHLRIKIVECCLIHGATFQLVCWPIN
jgi:hypothetical protein